MTNFAVDFVVCSRVYKRGGFVFQQLSRHGNIYAFPKGSNPALNHRHLIPFSTMGANSLAMVSVLVHYCPYSSVFFSQSRKRAGSYGHHTFSSYKARTICRSWKGGDRAPSVACQ